MDGRDRDQEYKRKRPRRYPRVRDIHPSQKKRVFENECEVLSGIFSLLYSLAKSCRKHIYIRIVLS